MVRPSPYRMRDRRLGLPVCGPPSGLPARPFPEVCAPSSGRRSRACLLRRSQLPRPRRGSAHADPGKPVFFTKAGALAGAHDDIVYPEGVRPDYEVELALVVGAPVTRHSVVTADNLPSYILGIAIMNDVSARDVQLAAGQWFLGKSFRTFAPLGPVVQTLDDGVLERLDALELELSAYNALGAPYDYKRQSGTTADMIFRPHELVRRLKEQFDLLPGDVIATGTPRGVALGRPLSRFRARLAEILGHAAGRARGAFSRGRAQAQSEIPGARDHVEARYERRRRGGPWRRGILSGDYATSARSLSRV